MAKNLCHPNIRSHLELPNKYLGSSTSLCPLMGQCNCTVPVISIPSMSLLQLGWFCLSGFLFPTSECVSAGGQGTPLLQIGTPLSQSGSLSHGRDDLMEQLSIYPMIQREVLNIIYWSFMKSSTRKSTVYTGGALCTWWTPLPWLGVGLYRLSVPSRVGTKVLMYSLLLWFLPRMRPLPSGVTDSCHSNGSPAWKRPRA